MENEKGLCPSANFGMNGEKVFGMLGGSLGDRRVIYLKQAVPVQQIDPAKLNGIRPSEVFRTAGRCVGSECANHDSASDQCSLVNRIVDKVSPGTEELAYCAIRPDCVWWHQQGGDACLRCAKVITQDLLAPADIAEARLPAGHR
ncbi:hypothetical protein [Chromobacterium sp. IIBBL 290-4]|uniref:hypothetical protein n=1 Tax=Chromobacterium sp. IIBBL 290-4 TaxID=2953890 RepID=UPI0020B8E677|nr:hypothetical protein [Chromobacterium sp. IIBBL 290-4]UTH75691.1 hypothetical protein NKT35_06220 [Chromobacterium sp. IIBBL 290-4]